MLKPSMSYKTKCAVPGCERDKAKDNNIQLHHFPCEVERQSIWLAVVGNKELCYKSVAQVQRHLVCDAHFDMSNYQTHSRQRLNRNAVPNLNLPQGEHEDPRMEAVVEQESLGEQIQDVCEPSTAHLHVSSASLVHTEQQNEPETSQKISILKAVYANRKAGMAPRKNILYEELVQGNKYYCHVTGCKNNCVDNPDKLYHKFCHNETLRWWLPKICNYNYTADCGHQYVICSDHFATRMYQTAARTRLNRNARPTLKLPDVFNNDGNDSTKILEHEYDPGTSLDSSTSSIQQEIDPLPRINYINENLITYSKNCQIKCQKTYNGSAKKYKTKDDEKSENQPYLFSEENSFSIFHGYLATPEIASEVQAGTSSNRMADSTKAEYTCVSSQPEDVTLENPLEHNADSQDISYVSTNHTEDVHTSIINLTLKTEPKDLISAEYNATEHTNITMSSRICRICVDNEVNLKNIFENVNDMSFYNKLLSTFVDLDLENTSMYNLVCDECCKNLEITYNFRVLCMSSEEKLQKYRERRIQQYLTKLDFRQCAGQSKEVAQKEGLKNLKETEVVSLENNYEIIEISNDVSYHNISDVIVIEDEIAPIIANPVPGIHEEFPPIIDVGEITSTGPSEVAGFMEDPEPRELNCNFCNQKFLSVVLLKHHMKDHYSQKTEPYLRYECPMCFQEFQNFRLLNKHKKDKHTPQILKPKKSYVCGICDKSFAMKSRLETHQLNHTRPFHCTICPKRFASQRNLTMHEVKHSGERPYKCDICSKTFPFPYNLKIHKMIHTGLVNVKYVCDICGKTFKCQSGFTTHMLRHSGQKKFKCENCDKRFLTVHQMKLHKTIHTGERPYKCEICGASYRINSQLDSHKKNHSDHKPFQCVICSRKFRSRMDYVYHLRIHTGEKPFKCEICGLEFSRKEQLKHHNLRIHLKDRKFKCDECDKKFYYRHSLRKHADYEHRGIKLHTCEYCGKNFKVRLGLTNHIKNVHLNIRRYECDKCDKKFKQSGHLKTHQLVHVGKDQSQEKILQCEICNRLFANNYCLRKHKSTHKGYTSYKCSNCKREYDDELSLKEHNCAPVICNICSEHFPNHNSLYQHKRFRCENQKKKDKKRVNCKICNKELSAGTSLKGHMRIHKNEKPYTCTFCDKSFTQLSSLKVHIYIHTGEKLFSCDICGKTFRQAPHLKAHKNWHLGIKPLSCPVCNKGYCLKRDMINHIQKIHPEYIFEEKEIKIEQKEGSEEIIEENDLEDEILNENELEVEFLEHDDLEEEIIEDDQDNEEENILIQENLEFNELEQEDSSSVQDNIEQENLETVVLELNNLESNYVEHE